ncbi:hypothetical protein V6N00_12570 [Tersicoccus sp. MR15.9]|uniref:hypothetical protein n=1 Tax=Tersicoccus mangrovi TaxID=3121635 RepID=UPI002FE522AE
MAYGQPSFIAVHLLGVDHPDLPHVQQVVSQTAGYPHTAGPHLDRVGGRANSIFTITAITVNRGIVYFADDNYLGWADELADVAELSRCFPRITTRMPGLHTDPEGWPLTAPPTRMR